MKLVKWSNGTYGVIRGWFMKEAVGDDGYWWVTRSYWPKYCEFPTEEAALKAAGKLPYKVIKRC